MEFQTMNFQTLTNMMPMNFFDICSIGWTKSGIL